MENEEFVKPKKEVTAVGVFDRINENSLLAAAVLKHYGHYPIVHVDQIDKVPLTPETQIFWLGFQPVSMVAFKLGRNTHFVVKPGANERPVAPNVKFLEGEHITITEQVVQMLVRPTFTDAIDLPENEFPESMKDLALWVGAAYLVNQFQSKTTDVKDVARAWNIIKSAFNFVHYGTKLEVSAYMDPYYTEVFQDGLVDLYLQDVAKAKKLLGYAGQTQFSHLKGQLVATHVISMTDCYIYLAKRLINMAGQGWQAPVVVLDELYYNSNKHQMRLAAVA